MTENQAPLRIAVDGPAASGKGTLAKRLAEELGIAYLDTGALYRAVGYRMKQAGLSLDDEAAAVACAKAISIEDTKNSHLYDEGVGEAASIVSSIPEVRQSLLSFQRHVLASEKGAVLDGRDIGTVICPDADFKFFITADVETRAYRRYKQLQNKDKNVIYESVLQDLQRRDARDSKRAIAPLKPASDAICIDTSALDADEVLKQVLSYVSAHSVAG